MSTENEKEPLWSKILMAIVQGAISAIVLFICLKIFGVI